MIPSTVADLRPAAYNPRTIQAPVLADLKKSMNEYGDLGGIVFNVRTGNLIGGHQRTKNLPPSTPVFILDKWDEPNAQGTIGVGSVTLHGEAWAVRLVDVDEIRERAMNIAANSPRGEWDAQGLAELAAQVAAGGYDLDVLGLRHDYLAGVLGEITMPVAPVAPVPSAEDVGPVQQHPQHRQVPVGVMVKLASLAVHVAEHASPQGHEADLIAARSLASSSDLVAWLATIDPVLLPVRRDAR